MKGMVYTLFSEMIEKQLGYDTWDELIDSTQPESDGIYVATDIYPDTELVNYVTALSQKTGIEASKLIFSFGEFTIRRFEDMHPEFFENHDACSFLQSVHDVIHVEVKKLHPDAILPSFDYEKHENGDLVMLYRSPRNLCALAEGLISGAGERFSTDISISHPICMHNGADHCRLELSFSPAKPQGSD